MQVLVDPNHVTPHILVIVHLLQIPVESGICTILNHFLEIETALVLEDPLVQRKKATCGQFNERLYLLKMFHKDTC